MVWKLQAIWVRDKVEMITNKVEMPLPMEVMTTTNRVEIVTINKKEMLLLMEEMTINKVNMPLLKKLNLCKLMMMNLQPKMLIPNKVVMMK